MIIMLKEFIQKSYKNKVINLYFDIETYQYNQKAGKDKPSLFKNMIFSVCVGYFDDGILKTDLYYNFKDLFEDIKKALSKWKTKPTITLNAHNGNRYDNHFLRWELLYYYDLPIKNLSLKNADDVANEHAQLLKQLSKQQKNDGVLLEKRIKSKNNLELIFFLDGICFKTVDNFMKTNTSIKDIGNRLLDKKIITKDQTKTDFDYLKYNKDEDMSDLEAKHYAKKIFNQLNKDEITYIKNDVIILAQSVKHYALIFYGFDYSKITFTSNIQDDYVNNELTRFQLLNRVKVGKNTQSIKYTDYEFNGKNFYDYLRPFYRGGLNLYNDKLIGQIIHDDIVTIDINSSYPYAMHKFKIPTFLKHYQSFKQPSWIGLDTKHYQLIQLSKEDFDNHILKKIKSRVLKTALVKYYTTPLSNYININSYTIKILNDFGLNIKELPVKTCLTFESEYFGSRDKISENYFTKTQGKQTKKINYKSPYDIKLTDIDNKEILSNDEIIASKVKLNGLYGIPALRPYFNLFRYENNDYINYRNGYKNNERNIIFSIFVTSVALWNLMQPLTYLTQKEIDEHFIYADTDSLYLRKKAMQKIPNSLLHDYHLGAWGVDDDNIKKMIVLNHKKYAYESNNRIHVRSAGIPNNSFNFNQSFESFVKNEFHDGAFIHNTKSILNEQGTISIYESTTNIEIGNQYKTKTNELSTFLGIANIKKEILEKGINLDDALYIESDIGTFSISELFPKEESTDGKSLNYLMRMQQQLKQFIN